MGNAVSRLSEPAVWHVLSYGVMIGSQFYQSFISGIVAFRALPRPQFSQLQQRIFPIYFLMQTFLPLIVLATTPGVPLIDHISSSSPQFKNVSIPLLVSLTTSLSNLVIFGPATTKAMKERKAQESRDGKKYYETGPKSKEMQTLNRKFAYVHGVSTLVNLAGFFAVVSYGFVLGDKLQAAIDTAQIILP
ncbi:hypothetical protein EDC01DRAFT_642889 [Geopyxis carbonaria]|nr:hypothetical protein EDC01DRAFT_642889 [Geopyxis carbonaria]